MPSGYALPDDFWTAFHATHWEKVGAVLERPFATVLATPEEVFSWVVAASDRHRAGDKHVQLEFCIGNAQQIADVGKYLPRGSDRCADGYHERVTNMLDGRRFGLVVEDVQAYDPIPWLRIREFLRGLYAVTGMPGDSAKATVFLGNYDRTPFGLHRGRSANFMFVADGQKRMRTWPDAFFHGKEDLTHRLDYEHYNAESIVMDAGPGDIIYWPSDYWHIGESVDGAFSSAVSVALFMEPRPSADVAARASGMLRSRLPSNDPQLSLHIHPAAITSSIAEIQRVAAHAVSTLRSVSEDADLVRTLEVGLMNRTTGYGFTSPPSPVPVVPLSDDATIRGDAMYPIIWMNAEDDDIVCSANGHAFTIAASPHVIALLERLNRGECARVGAFLAEHSGVVQSDGVEFDTSKADIRALLEKLCSLRAVAIVP